MSHIYRLYGLVVESEWPFPFIEPANAASADIEIYSAEPAFFEQALNSASGRIERRRSLQYAHLQNGNTYLRWPEFFECVVCADGRRIIGRPLAKATTESFFTYLLGQVLSFAILKQGKEPLHATVVQTAIGAIGFIGESGYGKSTLAAAFLRAGDKILTDDLLLLQEHNDAFLAFPGPPRLKLFPEIAKEIFGDSVNGTPMNHLTSKLILPLEADRFCNQPVPLKALYVLDPPVAGSVINLIQIHSLPPSKAFAELLKNTYNTVVTEPERLKAQFQILSRIIARVPIKLLCYPRQLSFLAAVRKAALSDR